ncbi:hypothetical protein [Methanobacterium aggregans]|uniref:hypothetical protein n=1 Tax=Methanobacterium aggregans TaxID=1615586 RepID=UPI001AEA51BE|nr:hypothetical protein [Methanobacterium aggregans]MBP2045154.1 hypothetical protein [Methanobacterium aggregans]
MKKKRFCLNIPERMNQQVRRASGGIKINLIAECLLIEYMTNRDLQQKVKGRLQAWRGSK